ncbi:MAG: FeoA domain-containing protein [Caldilineaceae bacterium]|nr:FeoA domain-containing protein [Caldilineaceae bacterium]HRJ42559.1 iron dependent repressor, metal binding and dimerization domain protein [Caldilineaceae bacterium]
MESIFTQPIFWLVVIAVLLMAGFWPGRGPFWRRWKNNERQRRVLIEDGLKHIYTFRQREIPVTVESLAGAVELNRAQASELIAEMEQSALLHYGESGLELTPKGEALALHVVRAHRLWETHLADKTGLAPTDWHSQAERQEHNLTPAELDALAASLGHPVYDPHGDPIPTEKGVDAPSSFALTEAKPNQTLRIVHLEDEPPVVFAQLVAEGLHPGMAIQVIEKNDQYLRFVGEGEERRLAPQLAANVEVQPVRQPNGQVLGNVQPLHSLRVGEEAKVVAVSRACRGPERRRLMDLGILPGVRIEVAMPSPMNDPVAYRVRDTLIALRRDQAQMILIERTPSGVAA